MQASNGVSIEVQRRAVEGVAESMTPGWTRVGYERGMRWRKGER